MAELNMPVSKNSRRKLQSPRVDLTPMVDLGFLLITFFMFTTSLMDPHVLDINMPAPGPQQTAFIDTSTITIIPIRGHKFAYYHGAFRSSADIKVTGSQDLRNLLAQKQSALKHLPAGFSDEAQNLHVIIKPHNESKYDDLVRVVDEMLILSVRYYAIVDITVEEEDAIGELVE